MIWWYYLCESGIEEFGCFITGSRQLHAKVLPTLQQDTFWLLYENWYPCNNNTCTCIFVFQIWHWVDNIVLILDISIFMYKMYFGKWLLVAACTYMSASFYWNPGNNHNISYLASKWTIINSKLNYATCKDWKGGGVG